MIQGILKVVNWNVGGAKYLELKSDKSKKHNEDDETREQFRRRLNIALNTLLDGSEWPEVVTLQEVVQYHESGNTQKARDVIDCPEDYFFYPFWLIDTHRHSAQGKWDKVRENGDWPPAAYFAQGNAILVRKDVGLFPIWSLPDVNVLRDDAQLPAFYRQGEPGQRCIEQVLLESGLYFGNRDTEPRAALVTHLVLSGIRQRNNSEILALEKPLDVFVINLHLTTLTMEREGVPNIDDEAMRTRLRQLDIVLNDIISPYNRWRREGFPIRGKEFVPKKDVETTKRHAPIWIIAGDFNFTPESTEYETLVRRGFIDLIAPDQKEARPEHRTGTKAKGFGTDPKIKLDYVFAGPRFEVIDPTDAENRTGFNHVNTDIRVSDHFPLKIDVPIKLDTL